MFRRELEDFLDFIDDSILIVLNVFGAVDFEIYLVRLLLRFCYLFKANVTVIYVVKLDVRAYTTVS